MVSVEGSLSAETIAQQSFGPARKGFDPDEVRSFLVKVAAEVVALHQRQAALEDARRDAEYRAAHPSFDEDTLLGAVGEETRLILKSAHDAAGDIKNRAGESASRILKDAHQKAEAVRAEAETVLAKRTEEAERVAAGIRDTARAEGERLVDQARQQAKAIRAQSEAERNAMIEAAQLTRDKVLSALTRKRNVAIAQIEALRAGRERLLDAYGHVRQTLDEVTADLTRAETEARAAADAVRHRTLALDEPDGLDDPMPTNPTMPVVSLARRPPTPASGPPPARPPAGIAVSPASGSAASASTRPATARSPGGAAPGSTGSTGSTRAAGSGRGGPPSATPPTALGAAVGARSPAPAPAPARAAAPAPAPPQAPTRPAVSSAPPAPSHSAASPRPAAPGPPAQTASSALAGAATSTTGAAAPSSGALAGEDTSSAPPATTAAPPAAPASDTSTPKAPSSGESTPEPPGTGESTPEPPASGGLTPAVPAKPSERNGSASTTSAFPTGGMAPKNGADSGSAAAKATHPAAAETPPAGGRAKPGDGQAGKSGDAVDSLFARIRAHRDRSVTKAREVLAQGENDADTTSGDPGKGEPGKGVSGSGGLTTRASAVEDPAGGEAVAAVPADRPMPDDDESRLQRRDQLLGPIEANLIRRLKRALQDDQNDLLDRLRSLRAHQAPATVLADRDEHVAGFREAALPFLEEALAAGATYTSLLMPGLRVAEPMPGVGPLANELASEIVDPLRRRLSSVLEAGEGDDPMLLAEAVGAAYREWKTRRVEVTAGDQVTIAFATGAYAGTPSGTLLRWLVDDPQGPCPDCDDNVLAGAQPKGEPFPTGQEHPPAHPGCRCVLIPEPAV